jgi:YVTN family beta-propeller protein
MTTGIAHPATSEPRARLATTDKTRRALASVAAAALLVSCGGGGEPTPATQSPQDTSMSKAQGVFVPTGAIPADANVAGMWSPVYDWPVVSVHSAILPDGRVLTYGSDLTGLQTGHANYDIWDSTGAPDAGHMTLPNTTGTDIFCSSQVLLPASGNVFIAGGDVWSGTGTTNGPNNNSNLLDAAGNTLTRGINMQRSRWYSSSITLINGETYIQGGSGGGDRPEIRGVDGSFRLMSGIDTSPLNTSFPRNFVAPDGRVFGYDSDSGQMYYVNPTGTGSIALGAKFNTAVSGSWNSSTAMYRPGRILQIGGNSNGAYTIDITGATPVVTPTQSMSSRRAWVNATVLADGKVVATSGSAVPNESTGFNNTAELWDPATGQWSQGAVAAKMRMYHSNAILLPDASVLTSGGGATQPTPLADPNKNNLNAEIYYPPYLFAAGGVRAARPAITTAPSYIDIGKTYGVDVSGAAGVSRVTLVKTGSMSHSFNFEQRFLDLTYKSSGTHVVIQAPTHAGEAPPGYYMLFVFNEAGVPSVAKIVRMGVAIDPNPATTPVISNPGAQTTTLGSVVNLALSAADPNADVLSYGASGLPPGLTLDTASGRISGTATTVGSYNVVVSATDGVNTASASFVWTVQAASPLTLATPPAPAFIAANGTASYTASATGGANLRYQWDFGDGSAKTAWSAAATATHAYAAGGAYTVTVSVTDDSGLIQSRSFTQPVYLPTTAKRPNASTNVLVETPASGNARLWVVNQDNDSVSAFDTVTFAKLGEVAVGTAPRAIALAPDGSLWVTNKQSATISVINPATRAVTRTIVLARGSQPFGVVMAPAANLAFVALEAGGSVLRFSTTSFAQTGSVGVGLNARHLSISGDGANLYVSRFITPPLPGEGTATVTTTASTGGEVVQVGTAALTVTRTIVLQHGEKGDAENQGRGIPNYLGAAVISPDGTQAYVAGKQDNIKRGTLRDGAGLNFQNTVRAISSRIELASGSETPGARIDHDNASVASAAVFEPHGVYLFVALETSREVAVINAFSGSQLFRVDVGRAPQGLALSADGKRLYVNNFMERSVSVLNLGPLLDQGVYDLPVLTTLAAVGTEKLAANVLLGKQLFYDARDTRLARDRYMSCAACHNDGGHDGRTWDLTSQGEGLRNTIALRGRASAQGLLHWSANFDEVQDFEGQIRTLAGGTGLMTDAQFNTGTRSQPLGDRKAGVSADLDALAAYIASLNTFAPSPYRNADGTLSTAAQAGRAVFQAKNCAQCHAGAAFTASLNAASVKNIGTLKASSGSRSFGPLTGIDIPTLRDVWATAPYLHDGSAPTLDAAVQAHSNVSLTSAELTSVVAYLREIGSDEATAPAPAPTVGTGLSASYFANRTLAGTPALTRTEAVDFDWGSGSPGTGVPVDNFSVRWSGTLVAPSAGSYTFQTYSDDGIRVWINGTALINHWTDHGPTTDTSAVITLSAGQVVSVVVEYYEAGGSAVARLRWRTPGTASHVAIPKTSLFADGVLTPPVVTQGNGLTARYFNNVTLAGTPALTRTEAVDFDWGTGSPGAGVNVDNFSVRWTGTVQTPIAGAYRFQTVSDDGVRLWVNGVPLIDNWSDHGPTTDTSATITLAAGQKYTVAMEYYERGGGAVARLRWLIPGTSTYAVVPSGNLYLP